MFLASVAGWLCLCLPRLARALGSVLAEERLDVIASYRWQVLLVVALGHGASASLGVFRCRDGVDLVDNRVKRRAVELPAADRQQHRLPRPGCRRPRVFRSSQYKSPMHGTGCPPMAAWKADGLAVGHGLPCSHSLSWSASNVAKRPRNRSFHPASSAFRGCSGHGPDSRRPRALRSY